MESFRKAEIKLMVNINDVIEIMFKGNNAYSSRQNRLKAFKTTILFLFEGTYFWGTTSLHY